MANDKDNAKSLVANAKQLAKKHGVSVLGWNDKPGQEFISFNGEGDRLNALQRDMEAQAWYTWPVEESQEGAFMDFARRPPQVGVPPKPANPRTKEIELDSSIAAPSKFHYAGLNALFRTHWPVFCVLWFLIVLPRRNSFFSTRAIIATAVFVVILALLIFCDWIEVSANDGKLVIRKHFCGTTKSMDLSDIKTARIFRQATGRRGKRTIEFIAVRLKSGKSFDLFLPPTQQTALVALIRQYIENTSS